MEGRGKKSGASISVVQPGISVVERPPAPDKLTDEEAHEWEMVVNRMPADWFPRETHGMLVQYCRHVVSAQRIADLIQDLLSKDTDSTWVTEYERLLKMQEREGRALSSLATRMRVSQQAQYNERKKTNSGKPVKKPWD